MYILRNVTLLGATGNVGAPVLNALLSTPQLSVTVLARPSSSIAHNHPEGAKVVICKDFSHETLVPLLRGTDALVITAGTDAFTLQHTLITAAVEAGVKRIIPSEFGSNLNNEEVSKLGVFQTKISVRKELQKLAEEGKIEWTGISNGALLDWGLKVGFLGIDVKNKKATLFDGGERRFSATLLGDVGKAVVGVLMHPEETKNRLVYVHSAVLTQNQLVGVYEKLLGEKLETTVADTEKIKQQGDEKIEKGDYSGFVDQIIRALWGPNSGSDYGKKVDNELFFIEQLTDEQLEEVVRSTL
ncbi:putative isoflavone reductase like protein P3 [Pyronema omphalodes]|nr:putative isoflavone reductase like protein P3 [Pyronema omphalodes]